MNTICFFCSYNSHLDIPEYIKYYLNELNKYCNKIVFITNFKEFGNESKLYLTDLNADTLFVENEGFDFGMWGKTLKKYDLTSYDSMLLVNDSCFLFKEIKPFFDWSNNTDAEYIGMTDSYQIAYHVQSYFLLIKGKAISETKKYFDRVGILKDRKSVIEQYEIGLCQHLVSKGFKINAWYKADPLRTSQNIVIHNADKLILMGFPLIKKKIIIIGFSFEEVSDLFKYKFNYDPKFYINLIKRVNQADLNKLYLFKTELTNKSNLKVFIFNFCGFILHRIYVIYAFLKNLLGKNGRA